MPFLDHDPIYNFKTKTLVSVEEIFSTGKQFFRQQKVEYINSVPTETMSGFHPRMLVS